MWVVLFQPKVDILCRARVIQAKLWPFTTQSATTVGDAPSNALSRDMSLQISDQCYVINPFVPHRGRPTIVSSSPTAAHACTPLSSRPPDGMEGTSLTKDHSITCGSVAPVRALTAYAVISEATEPRSFFRTTLHLWRSEPLFPTSLLHPKKKGSLQRIPIRCPSRAHSRPILPLGIHVETRFPGTFIAV